MWSNYGEIKEIKFEVKRGFSPPFLMLFLVPGTPIMHCDMTSYTEFRVCAHARIVREYPKIAYSSGFAVNQINCSLGRVAATKTWKKILKSTHRGKITLYLKRIHQYLSPVKFL